MAQLIRVALVDDYEVVVRGIAAMLRSYRDVIDIVELDANRPVDARVDIALYDTFAATQGDEDAVRDLVDDPRIDRVVVYTWVREPAAAAAGLANGVAAYLSKELPAAELVAALTAVARGEPLPVPPPARGVPALAGDWPGREEGLTQRESEVLALITQGLSNDEITARTHLSINSVKTYIRSAYRRIGVTDRTNAVLWGVDHGFRPNRIRVRRPGTSLSDTPPGALPPV